MKFRALLILAASLSLGTSGFADEAPLTFQVKVPEMKCTGCAWSIPQELKKLDHVSDVYVDAKTKTAIIATDSADAPGEKAILAAVKTAGYEGSGYTKLTVKFSEAKAAMTGGKG